MRRAMAGDQTAYRELLEQLAATFRRSIRGGLSRSGQGNAEVEDIVQEILLAVHLKRHTWDPALPFAPWVRAVARHKLVDAVRRQKVRHFVPLEEQVDFLAAPVDTKTDLGDAEKMISLLNARQQLIVRAVAIDGRSAAEVGREIDMTEGAVRVALHRALKELARLYREKL